MSFKDKDQSDIPNANGSFHQLQDCDKYHSCEAFLFNDLLAELH